MKLRTPPSREGFGQSYVICRGEVVRVGWAGEVPRTTPRVIPRREHTPPNRRPVYQAGGRWYSIHSTMAVCHSSIFE